VKRARREDREATHRKCFDMMDKLDEDLQLALAEKYDERAQGSQLLEKLRAEKAERLPSYRKPSRLGKPPWLKTRDFKGNSVNCSSRWSTSNATMQDQVSWNDVQLVLHQTHGELVSATTRFWNTIEAFQNRRLASYLPGSGVIHGDWTEQGGPLGTLSHSDLPGFSASGNLPLVTQQEPAPANVYSSLV
jgi:hypothetical protein